MPNSKSRRVQEAFQELEDFLRKAYFDGGLEEVTIKDINDFVWKLKKTYAFEGWDGIAAYLIVLPRPDARQIDLENLI